MKKLIPIFYIVCVVCLLSIMTGCGSTGSSGSASYYHTSAWGYDSYYRSDVDNHYNRQDARDRVEHHDRQGGGNRSGGGRGGGGRR